MRQRNKRADRVFASRAQRWKGRSYIRVYNVHIHWTGLKQLIVFVNRFHWITEKAGRQRTFHSRSIQFFENATVEKLGSTNHVINNTNKHVLYLHNEKSFLVCCYINIKDALDSNSAVQRAPTASLCAATSTDWCRGTYRHRLREDSVAEFPWFSLKLLERQEKEYQSLHPSWRKWSPRPFWPKLLYRA